MCINIKNDHLHTMESLYRRLTEKQTDDESWRNIKSFVVVVLLQEKIIYFSNNVEETEKVISR